MRNRTRMVSYVGLLLLAVMTVSASLAPAQSQPGAEPKDAWSSPATHPIKGNFTTYSGDGCIYHSPGGQC